MTRDAAAAALGFDTLRFDSVQVLYEWPMVEAAILAKLAQGLASLRFRNSKESRGGRVTW